MFTFILTIGWLGSEESSREGRGMSGLRKGREVKGKDRKDRKRDRRRERKGRESRGREKGRENP